MNKKIRKGVKDMNEKKIAERLEKLPEEQQARHRRLLNGRPYGLTRYNRSPFHTPPPNGRPPAVGQTHHLAGDFIRRAIFERMTCRAQYHVKKE